MQPRLSALQAPHGQFTTTFAGTVQVPVPYFRRHAEDTPQAYCRDMHSAAPPLRSRCTVSPLFRAIPLPTSPILPDDAGTAPTHPHDRPRAHLRLQSATVHSTVLRPGTEIEIASCDGAVALRHSPWHRCINGRQPATAPHRTFSALQLLPGCPPTKTHLIDCPGSLHTGNGTTIRPERVQAHARTRTDYSSNTN